MSINLFQTVKDALTHLNPHEIREEADRPLRVGLYAPTELAYRQMEAYFAPANLSNNRRAQVAEVVQRAAYGPSGPRYDLEIFSEEVRPSPNGYTFYLHNPDYTVRQILKSHAGLAVALARNIPPFQRPVAEYIIKKIARENAYFSLATAIPDVIPFLALPWAIG